MVIPFYDIDASGNVIRRGDSANYAGCGTEAQTAAMGRQYNTKVLASFGGASSNGAYISHGNINFSLIRDLDGIDLDYELGQGHFGSDNNRLHNGLVNIATQYRQKMPGKILTMAPPSTQVLRPGSQYWCQALNTNVHSNYFAHGGSGYYDAISTLTSRGYNIDFVMPQIYNAPCFNPLLSTTWRSDSLPRLLTDIANVLGGDRSKVVFGTTCYSSNNGRLRTQGELDYALNSISNSWSSNYGGYMSWMKACDDETGFVRLLGNRGY